MAPSLDVDRREFLLSLAAIGFSAALVRCRNNGGGTAGTVAVANGKATLTFAEFPSLASAGNGVVVDVSGASPIVVVRKDATSAVAFSAVCTHQGCTVDFDSSTKGASCPCHGSAFDANGQVTRGPASRALQIYQASVGTDSIVVVLG